MAKTLAAQSLTDRKLQLGTPIFFFFFFQAPANQIAT